MTQQAQLKLEDRFSIFKASVSAEQWSGELFLLKKVEELEPTDVALAFRLMQRVKNLNPSDANRQKLTDLKTQALQKRPDLATTSSTESKIQMNLIGNTQSLLETIAAVQAHSQMSKI